MNITQAYPLIVRPNGKPAVAIMVDNIETAMDTFNEKGFTIVTEGDLGGDGDFCSGQYCHQRKNDFSSGKDADGSENRATLSLSFPS